ncbi:hypothetical protein K0M31_000307 [Melipona bicolor]|uniref:Uncharacterized protein n=1 Tax=Melipona bicolor TaxID=60889 RepID=A0AA40KWL0_9HYME|nr:hypothetical protein K0M31_000307 [Melipona bicolor]
MVRSVVAEGEYLEGVAGEEDREKGCAPVSDLDVYGVASERSRRTPRWFCDQCQESASKFAGVGV